jgi:peroxiredoxin
MAALDHYPFTAFVHILGALGLFIALAFEWLAVFVVRDNARHGQSDARVSALALARRIGPASMALLLVPGLLMAYARWNSRGWPSAGAVGMAAMVVVGLLMRRWPTLALQSVEIRIASALGVVALMVFKLDLLSSLVILGVATALGAGVSFAVHGGPKQHQTRTMGKLRRGSILPHRELQTITGAHVSVADDSRLVHLQFRRFAGCPVCNLHLRSIVRRHAEVVNAQILEVVVFHSTREELLEHAADLPFAVVADPRKELYSEFGVEASPRALVDPRVWLPILVGVAWSAMNILTRRRRAPSLTPTGGRFGLPADFLIASDGRLLAVKYGLHAYDQWSVDELLALARPVAQSRTVAASPAAHAAR